MKNFSKFLPIYNVILMGYFGYGLIISLFIPMIMSKTSLFLPLTTATGLRTAVSGALIAMYPLGQFLGSPIIGAFSDHFGRRCILLLTLLFAVCGYFAIAFSIHWHNLIALFLSCFITGLFESNMAIGQSIMVDQASTPHEKSKLIGYMYTACSLGYIFGPLSGGFIVLLWGYATPFYITATAILLLAAWVRLTFNEPPTPHKGKIHYTSALLNLKTVFTDKTLRPMYAINFLIFLAVFGLYRLIPIYQIDRWHVGVHIVTLFIAYISTICLVANLFFTGPLTKRFALQPLLIGLTAIGGITICTIVIPHQFHWIWLSAGLAVIPTVIAISVCTTWISNAASRENQGKVLGNNQALLVLAESTSAVAGGMLAAFITWLPIVVSGVILIAVAGLLMKRNKNALTPISSTSNDA